jgi:hypothetical protein
MNYQMFIEMKHSSQNKKQATHEVKPLRAILHLSYILSMSWVDFDVSIMFCSFLALSLFW